MFNLKMPRILDEKSDSDELETKIGSFHMDANNVPWLNHLLSIAALSLINRGIGLY